MRVYRLISQHPYNETRYDRTTECSALHIKALDVHRRLMYISETGMDIPDTPCIIIDDDVKRGTPARVILPNGDIWNLGGRTYTHRDCFVAAHYASLDPTDMIAYIIWKNK